MRSARCLNRPAIADGDPLLDRQTLEALFGALYRHATASGEELTLEAWLELVEAWLISNALEATGGNRKEAARAPGIARRTLYHRMKKLALATSPNGGDSSGPSSCVGARSAGPGALRHDDGCRAPDAAGSTRKSPRR